MTTCKTCGFDQEHAQELWTLLRERCESAEQELDALKNAVAWVSVEDRLPEVGRRVIATDDLFMNVAVAYIAHEPLARPYWIWAGHINRVDYWMPMPEAHRA